VNRIALNDLNWCKLLENVFLRLATAKPVLKIDWMLCIGTICLLIYQFMHHTPVVVYQRTIPGINQARGWLRTSNGEEIAKNQKAR
jgi:hypothetical protein